MSVCGCMRDVCTCVCEHECVCGSCVMCVYSCTCVCFGLFGLFGYFGYFFHSLLTILTIFSFCFTVKMVYTCDNKVKNIGFGIFMFCHLKMVKKVLFYPVRHTHAHTHKHTNTHLVS